MLVKICNKWWINPELVIQVYPWFDIDDKKQQNICIRFQGDSKAYIIPEGITDENKYQKADEIAMGINNACQD